MPAQLLDQIADTLAAAQTIEQLTRPLLELLELITGLESTYLTRIDLEAGVQTIVFARNSHTMQIPEGLSVPWNDTLCKRALAEGRFYTTDVAACWGDSDAARGLGIQTYVSTPVYLAGDMLYGTLCAASTRTQPLTPAGKEILRLFSILISQHIEREHLLERLQRANAALEADSSTDALTGLPNRRFVLAEMERLFAIARRTGRRVMVAFIDLDGFKAINDTHGHDAGDAFLVEAGRRLSAGLRAGDVLGRLGGDEFIIVGLTSPAEEKDGVSTVERVHQRLAPLLRGRFALGACALDYPGASIGVVTAEPTTTTPDEALRTADAQMYLNKKLRRDSTARAAACA